MNISLISNINAPKVSKINNKGLVVPKTGLSKDTCQFSSVVKKNEKFSLNEAVGFLQEIKSFNGKPKFKPEKIEELSAILSENPEKWSAIKTISQEPKMISSLVLDFAKRDVETLNAIADLAVRKDSDGKPQFSPLEIKSFASELEGTNLAKVGALAQLPFDSDEIIEIAKDKNISNIPKLVKKVNGFIEQTKDVRRVSFDKDEFDESSYVIRIDSKENGSRLLLLDRNLDERATETIQMQTDNKGNLLQVKTSKDYKTNVSSKIVSIVDKNLPTPMVIEEVKVRHDSMGRAIKKEEYSLSDVSGTPNIVQILPNGDKKVISSATIDKNTGKTIIHKDMTSVDGTRTQYDYEDSPNGNMSSRYTITDKNGNVLLNQNITFTVIDENTFISTENDKKYKIQIIDDKISVVNLQNNDTKTIDLDTKTTGNREKLLASLKRMPAEEILSMDRTTEEIIGIDNTYQSTFAATTKTIKSGDNLFTILHEIGHAKDYEDVNVQNKSTLINALFENPELNKVFEAEKSAFNAVYPLAQREHISYFIKSSEHKDGLQEVIAESNALLNSKNTEDLFSIRSHYLQQYFPRTIALLSTMID